MWNLYLLLTTTKIENIIFLPLRFSIFKIFAEHFSLITNFSTKVSPLKARGGGPGGAGALLFYNICSFCTHNFSYLSIDLLGYTVLLILEDLLAECIFQNKNIKNISRILWLALTEEKIPIGLRNVAKGFHFL